MVPFCGNGSKRATTKAIISPAIIQNWRRISLSMANAVRHAAPARQTGEPKEAPLLVLLGIKLSQSFVRKEIAIENGGSQNAQRASDENTDTAKSHTDKSEDADNEGKSDSHPHLRFKSF